MAEVETGLASGTWAGILREKTNALVGLASTSSGKYDEFKRWLTEELEVTPSVCYLSELGKQWTARVGQALMGLPSLLVLLIEGQQERDVVARLEKLHGYATGLEATLVFSGTQGAWQLDAVVGLPGRPAFEQLRGVVADGKKLTGGRGHPRVARPGGRFFDSEPDSQAELAWAHLVGLGSLPAADAIGIAAKALRDDGLLDYTRLRADGLVYSELEAAIGYASRRGFLFDRPRRGHIRALKADPNDFTREDWRTCLLTVLSTETWVERDVAVRDAAMHAVEVFGLNMVRLRSGGRVDSAIRSALNGLLRLGQVERGAKDTLRRNAVPRVVSKNAKEHLSDSAAIRSEGSPDSMLVNGPTDQLVSDATSTEQASPSSASVSTTAPPERVATPEQLRRLVGHLPAESEATFERLLGEPEKTRDELRASVRQHVLEFERAFANHEFLDMGGAKLLGEQAEELLRTWDELTLEQRRIAQAGIGYFVTSEEADHDFVIDGLRTDKAVMAAVLDAVL